MLGQGEVPYWLVREYLGERGRAQGYDGEQLGHWVNEEQNQLQLVDRRSPAERERESKRLEAADKAKKEEVGVWAPGEPSKDEQTLQN